METREALELVTPPAVEPLLLPDAKAHLRVDIADDDALITTLIKAAREWCEGYQNRAFITQTWRLHLDAWPREYIRIPRPPLQSVTSVKYTDSAGSQTTWPAAEYLVDVHSEPGRIVPAYGKSWPTATLQPVSAIEVEFVAGHGDAATDLHERIIQAMKLLVGHLYENREATVERALVETPFAVKALLGLDRIWPV